QMRLINATVQRHVLIVGFNDILPTCCRCRLDMLLTGRSCCRLFNGEEEGGVATEEGDHR
ncbi:hypothetical protein ACLOJK_028481, partial [Asimina triloba]